YSIQGGCLMTNPALSVSPLLPDAPAVGLPPRRVFLPLAWALVLGFALSAHLEASLPRGVSGDYAADRILGKPDYSEVNPYSIVGNKLWLPHGVVVDRANPSANKLYIYDAGNNRILGFDLNTCRSSVTDPLNCT